ncbi:MAG: hypothetical protein QG639_959 [Patescibacteria group bacterium]|jgi:fimbrial isopeptide formation D2 family protein/uncharacterized repeat protein (TIGR01451 family)|nr:hypothetical protein [Patescibacteria group bacterium]
MLNKITEPQAVYSKAPTPGQPAHASFTTPPKKKSNFNWKIGGSIIAVCLIAVVGVAGVLIAQRQQADQSPVAPNAPESRPSAAIEPTACSLSFEVKAPVVPPPEPGAPQCVSKTASLITTVNSKETKTPLTANTKVKRGDTIEYAVTVKPTTVNTDATIIDTLPTHVDYVRNSAKINGVSPGSQAPYDSATHKMNVPVSFGSLTNRVLTYRVTVKSTAPATGTAANFTNAATLSVDGKTLPVSNSCKITLAVLAPPSGVASCVSKQAFKANGSPYGTTGSPLVKRGEVVTYKITVKANSETGGPVVVKDVLPAALTYKAGSARIGTSTPTATQFSASGQTLTFTLGTMANTTTNKELVLTYAATVKADAAVAPFVNSVAVSTNGTAATTPAACKVSLQVAPVGVAACQSKEAFTNYGGTKIANDSVVQKGTTFAYKLTVTATEQTAGQVAVVDTLPSTLEFVESKDNTLQHSNGKLTATLPQFGATVADRTKVFEYKVKVKDSASPGKFENAVTVTTAGNTAQADSCKWTLHVPYQCDSTCTTDAQCNNNGSGTTYVCSEDAGNKCRLASNPESNSCSGTSTEYSCNSSCSSDSQCQDVDEEYVCAETSEGDRCRHKDYPTRTSCEEPPTSTPTPTPAIGCNDGCVSNADCSNPNHICYNDGTSQVCRLETNPTSASCTNPGTTTITSQPELPQELPQTGPEDWVNWLKAGLITLGIGAALLLLL